MSLLKPPLLFSLEVYIPIAGPVRSSLWPADARQLPPETRRLIMQALQQQLDLVAGELGCRLTYEATTRALTADEVKQVLG